VNGASLAGPWLPWQRALALLAWVLAMAVGGAVIARSHFSADLSAFLPASPDPGQQVLIEQLRSGVTARTLMLAIRGGEPNQRAEASRALGAALRALPEVEQVHNGDVSVWRSSGAAQWLFAHRYHLSPDVTPERYTAQGLRDAIDDTLVLLGTPAGAMVKPVLEQDPTGETRRVAEAMMPAQAPRTLHGTWASRDGQRAVLLVQGRAPGSDLDGQQALIRAIQKAFERAAAAPGAQGLELQMSGPPLFAVESRERIEQEVHRLAIAGTLLMGGVLWLAFASMPALAVAFVPVASGVVAGIAAVSLGFGTVHGITLGFGSTLIGEAVDYAIYYLIQARVAAAPGTGWRVWHARSWPTVRLGLLTSVCGFAALVFSGFPGLAQLGVFSLAGLVAAALATRWVLPACLPDGAAGQGLRGWLGRQAWAASVQAGRLRVPFIVVGLLVCVALAAMVSRHGTLWQGDLASLSPVPAAQLQQDESLRRDLGANDAGTLVVVQAPGVEATLRAAEAVGRALDHLVEQGTLAGYDSPVRWLPSMQTQRERLHSLPDPAALRQRLAEATEGGPLPARRLEPFVAAVQQARGQPPITREALAGGPFAPLVDAMLMPRQGADGGRWMALLSLQPGSEPMDAAALERTLQSACGTGTGGAAPSTDRPDLPTVTVLEIKRSLDALYARYLAEALWQSGLGALGVVVLMAVALRQGRRLLSVCLPLALAVVLTLGLLVAAAVPLGILHLVGLLLVVAVGSNYALFFDQWHRSGAVDTEALASLVLANGTTVLSFGLIATSGIPALSAIGQVVAPGALLALVLSAAFAPPPAGR